MSCTQASLVELKASPLQELGLALAEARQIDHEIERVREIYERVLEDQARVTERTLNALRLWEDAE